MSDSNENFLNGIVYYFVNKFNNAIKLYSQSLF